MRCHPPHQKELSVLPLLGRPSAPNSESGNHGEGRFFPFFGVRFRVCVSVENFFLSSFFFFSDSRSTGRASFLLVHLRFKLRFSQSIAITNLNCHVPARCTPGLLLCTVSGGMRRSLCRARLIGRHSPEKLFAWLSEVWRTNKYYLETKPRRESRLGRF